MNLTLYPGTFYSMSCFELKLNKVEDVEWLYVESRDKATDNTGGGGGVLLRKKRWINVFLNVPSRFFKSKWKCGLKVAYKTLS